MPKTPNEKERQLLHDVRKIIESIKEIVDLLEKENACIGRKKLAVWLKRSVSRLEEIIEDEFWGWTQRKE